MIYNGFSIFSGAVKKKQECLYCRRFYFIFFPPFNLKVKQVAHLLSFLCHAYIHMFSVGLHKPKQFYSFFNQILTYYTLELHSIPIEHSCPLYNTKVACQKISGKNSPPLQGHRRACGSGGFRRTTSDTCVLSEWYFCSLCMYFHSHPQSNSQSVYCNLAFTYSPGESM